MTMLNYISQFINFENCRVHVFHHEVLPLRLIFVSYTVTFYYDIHILL